MSTFSARVAARAIDLVMRVYFAPRYIRRHWSGSSGGRSSTSTAPLGDRPATARAVLIRRTSPMGVETAPRSGLSSIGGRVDAQPF